MRLYLLRHATAEAFADAGDAARPLTQEGHAEAALAVQSLRQEGVDFYVAASPWRRAHETAMAFQRADLELWAEMASPPGAGLLARIKNWKENQRQNVNQALVLVGHQPWLSELAATLVFGDASIASRMELSRAGCIRLFGEPRRGGMQWLIPQEK